MLRRAENPAELELVKKFFKNLTCVVSVNQNTGGKTFVRRTLPIYLEQTRRTRRTRIKIK